MWPIAGPQPAPGAHWDGSPGRAALGHARPVLVLAGILGVGLVAAGAVQWQAPAGCPEAAAVERRVIDLLGRTPGEHELRAVGVVHAGPPWRLELETIIGGQVQRRSLLADDCRAVAEAAALILAVSVDPLGVDPRLEPREPTDDDVVPPGPLDAAVEPTAGPPAPPRASVEVDAPAVATARAPGRPRARVRLRLGGGGEWGAVPGGTGGLRWGVGIEGTRALVRLEGSYFFDRLAPLRDGSDLGARVGLGTVGLHGGVRLGRPRVTVPLVAGLEAGGLRTRPVGLANAQRLTLPWVAGVVGVGAEWSPARRLSLWAAVEGALPLIRLRVRVGRGSDGSTVLYEPSAVEVRALVGLSVDISRAR